MKKGETKKAVRHYQDSLRYGKASRQYAAPAMEAIGGLQERVGEYRKAAESYELYAKKYAKKSEKPRYVFKAAVLWMGLGKNSRAYNHFARYILKNKARKEEKQH